MTATNQHIRFSGRGNTHHTSHQYRIIKGLAKIVAIIIGSLITIVLWVVVKPIVKGIGWVISLITSAVIIYWILTL